MSQIDNRRIAKNTLILYFRMFLMMAISLYTSRIILSTLGVEDYGIYNVVAGVVLMFNVLSSSLSGSISRFITFELGRNDLIRLKKIFCTAINVQVLMAIIVGLSIELLGVWFLNNKMVIPSERLYAANWVLQCSTLSFCINLISVPYNASIIAHERMSAFAYISIIEAVLKLGTVFLLWVFPFDKLILYSIITMCISVLLRTIYGIYCKKHFEECQYQFLYDGKLLKEIFSFAGWNFIGSSSAILRVQGTNILLNLFFGPIVNAARGIAVQVNHTIHQFTTNFMMALNPQITKSYAQGNSEYMFTLIFKGARLSYFILLLLSLPVLFCTEPILKLWLNNYPDHAVEFTQLSLIIVMSESISNPLITAQSATGQIKNYQIVVGGINLLNLPISYFCLSIGAIPESVYFVGFIISQCCLAARLSFLKNMISLNVRDFIHKVYLKIVFVTIFSIIPPFIAKHLLQGNGISQIIIFIIAFFSTGLVVLYVGCTQKERQFVYTKYKELTHKFFYKR